MMKAIVMVVFYMMFCDFILFISACRCVDKLSNLLPNWVTRDFGCRIPPREMDGEWDIFESEFW